MTGGHAYIRLKKAVKLSLTAFTKVIKYICLGEGYGAHILHCSVGNGYIINCLYSIRAKRIKFNRIGRSGKSGEIEFAGSIGYGAYGIGTVYG